MLVLENVLPAGVTGDWAGGVDGGLSIGIKVGEGGVKKGF